MSGIQMTSKSGCRSCVYKKNIHSRCQRCINGSGFEYLHMPRSVKL